MATTAPSLPSNNSPLDPIMIRVSAGDHEAFAVVVDALQWPLRCWLAVRCPPQIDPDEIAHLALVEAFRCRERYQMGTNLRAWIWGIARHKLLSELATLRRASDRRAQGNAADIIDQLVASDDDEGEDDVASEVAALRQCLADLRPEARDLLARHYDVGQPLADIAACVGRSLTAIKKALFVLRRRLRDCMQSRLRGDSA